MSQRQYVSAAEANRQFSKILRAVKGGASITITSHGEPVADLTPHKAKAEDERMASRLRTLEEMKARWESTEPMIVGAWTREELYER